MRIAFAAAACLLLLAAAAVRRPARRTMPRRTSATIRAGDRRPRPRTVDARRSRRARRSRSCTSGTKAWKRSARRPRRSPRAQVGDARTSTRSAPRPRQIADCRAQGVRLVPGRHRARTSARPAPSPKSGRTRRISPPSCAHFQQAAAGVQRGRRRRRRERDQGELRRPRRQPARRATTSIARRCTTEREPRDAAGLGPAGPAGPLAARRR